MTNKPMLSVELLPCPMCGGKVREPAARPIGHSDVCFVVSCNCGLSFDGGQTTESAVRTWNRRATPAAQLLEPMAYWFVGDIGGYGCLYTTPDKDGIKLYAEQPAPVAVVMPDRKSEEPTDYRRPSDLFEAELYNSALDDVARLNGVDR